MFVSLRQSERSRLTRPDTFLWCTGIEDTFITAPHPQTGRALDEYELTGHYERWSEDIGLIAQLGVKCARYGIPWHRIAPQRGKWEWQWTDRAVEKLLDLKIEPIIDLVHYGLPNWIEGAYLNPDFPEYMAEYAGQVAARYRGRVHAYTPLNEPRITAWYCGRIGWWPPFQRSWHGFVLVMRNVCRGIVRTVEVLEQVDPEILPVHVDATDLYQALDESLETEAAHRQEIVFLALDLISGRLRPGHPLYAWVLKHGITENDLAWFAEHAIELPLIGINLYPMFTKKIVTRSAGGRFRIKMEYAEGSLVQDLSRLYSRRYDSPLFVSETASVGSVKKRAEWLTSSIAATKATRAEGIPLVGYTWWPLFALVTWAYRQGAKPAPYYLKQMGLWDLTPDLNRVSTPLVEAFQKLTGDELQHVGILKTGTD